MIYCGMKKVNRRFNGRVSSRSCGFSRAMWPGASANVTPTDGIEKNLWVRVRVRLSCFT